VKDEYEITDRAIIKFDQGQDKKEVVIIDKVESISKGKYFILEIKSKE
jgi:hypothetical protein